MRLSHGSAVMACLLGTACSHGDASEIAVWRGSAELRDSVWVVTNPDAPVFDSAQARLTPEWAVELLPDSVVGWEYPGQVRMLHGVAYVLDLPAHRIAAFDTLGRRIVAFGREGAGPGEMEAPTELVVMGDAIGVDDGRLGRAIFFDEKGDYLQSIPIPQMSFVLPASDSTILVQHFESKEPGWLLVSADTSRNVGHLSDLGAPYTERDAGCQGDAADNVILLAATCSRPSVLYFSPAMRLASTVSISRPAQHATDEQIALFKSFMDMRLSKMPVSPDAKAGIIEVALKNNVVRKDIHGIAADSAGGLIAVWSQIGMEYGGGNAWVDVLSLSGVYLARVARPRPLKAFDLDKGRLVTLAEDSLTGTVTLRSARIELPEGWRAVAAEADSITEVH